MILTPDSAPFFLIDRGFLTTEALLEGPFEAVESGGLNRGVRVLVSSGNSYFLKQPRDPDRRPTWHTEAACYRLAEQVPALGRCMPKFYEEDRVLRVLVSELVTEARMPKNGLAFQPSIAAMLGDGLAQCHFAEVVEAARNLEKKEDRRYFPRTRGWVWKPPRKRRRKVRRKVLEKERILNLVRRIPHLVGMLEDFGQRVPPIQRLIHGDLKWRNLLISSHEDRITILDWEMAGIGDPARDVGAIFQGFLADWILSMSDDIGLSEEERVASAFSPLEEMETSIRAFWEAYSARCDLPKEGLLTRCTAHAGSRLVQTAYERATLNKAELMLQLAANILSAPESAAVDLLGLDLSEGGS